MYELILCVRYERLHISYVLVYHRPLYVLNHLLEVPFTWVYTCFLVSLDYCFVEPIGDVFRTCFLL